MGTVHIQSAFTALHRRYPHTTRADSFGESEWSGDISRNNANYHDNSEPSLEWRQYLVLKLVGVPVGGGVG